MQYNLQPIPYVKTLRVLDERVYCYFIGRPEQSMSAEKLIRNYPQHLRVMYWMVDFYANLPEWTSPSARNYILQIEGLTYNTNADILCKKLPKLH